MFTIEELNLIHIALISRERNLPSVIEAFTDDSKRKEALQKELEMISYLKKKACYIKIRLELDLPINLDEVGTLFEGE